MTGVQTCALPIYLAADRLVLSPEQVARLAAAVNQRTVHGTRYNTATQAEIDTEEF